MTTRTLELNLRARADTKEIEQLAREFTELSGILRKTGAAFEEATGDAQKLVRVFANLSDEEQKQVRSAAATAAAVDRAAAARERAAAAASNAAAAEARSVSAQQASERAAVATATAQERLAQSRNNAAASVSRASAAEEKLAQERQRTFQATAKSEKAELDVARAREQLRAATARAEQAEKRMAEARKSTGLATDIVRKQLQALVTGGLALAAGRQLIQFGRDSITAASDAEEAAAKFNQVFKSLAEGVRGDLEEMATANRRSIYDLVDYASTLQDTFVPLGFARDQAAEMSKTIVQLGVDIAAFSNKADSDVIDNLTSALVGNHEAVRSYGIVLTETVLKQELSRLGYDNLTGAALETAKAQARLNIIMRASADAQGAAVREADSYSNTLKAWDAAAQELSVALGEGLLPMMTELVEIAIQAAEVLKAGGAFSAPFEEALDAADTTQEIVEIVRQSKRDLDDLDFWDWIKVNSTSWAGLDLAEQQMIRLAELASDTAEFQKVIKDEFSRTEITALADELGIEPSWNLDKVAADIYEYIQALAAKEEAERKAADAQKALQEQYQQIFSAQGAIATEDIVPAWIADSKTANIMDAWGTWAAELGNYAYAAQQAAAAQKEFNLAFGEAFTNAPVDDLVQAQRDLREALGGGQYGQAAAGFTADIEAAEEARIAIEEANQAIIDSYYDRAYNSIAARMIEAGQFEQLATVAVGLGIMTQEEANLRMEYAATITALDELTAATAFYGLTAGGQIAAVSGLASGFYDTAAAALAAAQNAQRAQEELSKFYSTAPDSNQIGQYYQSLADQTPDSDEGITTTVSVSIDPNSQMEFETFRGDLEDYDAADYRTTVSSDYGTTMTDFERMHDQLSDLTKAQWIIKVKYETEGAPVAQTTETDTDGIPGNGRSRNRSRSTSPYIDLTVNNYGGGDLAGAVKTGVLAAFRSLG